MWRPWPHPCLANVIRDGENGWQYRDAADFQKKLDSFLAQPHRRKQLSENARRSAQAFSAERFAESVEAVYQAQIARHSGRGKAVPA